MGGVRGGRASLGLLTSPFGRGRYRAGESLRVKFFDRMNNCIDFEEFGFRQMLNPFLKQRILPSPLDNSLLSRRERAKRRLTNDANVAARDKMNSCFQNQMTNSALAERLTALRRKPR